jgi:hypothetical protein
MCVDAAIPTARSVTSPFSYPHTHGKERRTLRLIRHTSWRLRALNFSISSTP